MTRPRSRSRVIFNLGGDITEEGIASAVAISAAHDISKASSSSVKEIIIHIIGLVRHAGVGAVNPSSLQLIHRLRSRGDNHK